MEMQAVTRAVRISPRKVSIVADVIRNMPAKAALNVLSLVKKRGASVLTDTLKSAIANALKSGKIEEEKLIISRIEVNEGPFLKRFHASTRGRTHPYKKRSSHVRIILEVKNGK